MRYGVFMQASYAPRLPNIWRAIVPPILMVLVLRDTKLHRCAHGARIERDVIFSPYEDNPRLTSNRFCLDAIVSCSDLTQATLADENIATEIQQSAG